NNSNGNFRRNNGILAQQLDSAKAQNTQCKAGDTVFCAGDQLGQCVGTQLFKTSCSSGLKCQVLPLVNKPGTSVACTTDADKTARIQAALNS
ncbi:uncharacterized protein BJ171DRAFT_425989, partial [Polychytrium aggregatum]|uniref:uncharacterized protein n=1 Tax=Polychytrium aggregatum TaxID=110093 RepID=UPI0022FDFDBE